MGKSSDGFVTGPRSPEFKGGVVWKLERCGAKEKLKMIVLSEEPLMVATHFISRASKPCRTDDCAGCKAHLETRWNGYLAIALLPHKTKCLVEYTEGSQGGLFEAIDRFGSLRGTQLVMSRPRGLKNSPMLIQCVGRQENLFDLPESPDVFLEMCRIWRVNDQAPAVTKSPKRQPIVDDKKSTDRWLDRELKVEGRFDLTQEEKTRADKNRDHVGAQPLKEILDNALKQNGKH